MPRKDYFLYADDTEYALRMAAAGWRFFWIPGSQIVERRKEDKQRLRILGREVFVYAEAYRFYYAVRNSIHAFRTHRRHGELRQTLAYAAKMALLLSFVRTGENGGRAKAILHGVQRRLPVEAREARGLSSCRNRARGGMAAIGGTSMRQTFETCRCPYCLEQANPGMTVGAHRFFACPRCHLVFREGLDVPEKAVSERRYYENDYFRELAWDQLEGYRDGIFREVLDRIEGQTGRGRLLDVGCGCGFFLREALARGWEAKGIDPSRESIDYLQATLGDVGVAGNAG